MIKLQSPYQTRPIRFLHLAHHEGWRIKVYGIRFGGDENNPLPNPDIVHLAQAAVLTHLPQPAITDTRYGLGFLIIHQGQQRNWLLLDWWYEQDVLKQLLFSSPLDDPTTITPAESDLLACTWELAVHGFEREAWIETVLKNHANPDVERYLARHLNADV